MRENKEPPYLKNLTDEGLKAELGLIPYAEIHNDWDTEQLIGELLRRYEELKEAVGGDLDEILRRSI
jgi:hypothetical protein